MTNEFEQMYDNEDFGTDGVSCEDVTPTDVNDSVQVKPDVQNDEEVSMDNYTSYTYIKTPEVGNFIEFTVDKILNIKDPSKLEAVNKTTKEKFPIGVKKKDGTIIRHDIVTSTGERFVLNSWALFGLFQDRKGVFAEAVRKNGAIKGIKLKLIRNYDGSVPKKKTVDVMKLYNLKSLEEAELYKKEVTKAQDEERLFSIEIIKD